MAGEHTGHRHRIIERIDSGTLKDHELLEVLLFNAVPRKNTNDLAHRLLSAFGDIPSIFKASVSELMSVSGVGESVAAYIKVIGEFYKVYNEDKTTRTIPVKFEDDEFRVYIENSYSLEKTEVFDLYFINEKSQIVHRKRFCSNETNKVVIDQGEISKLVAQFKPYAIVAVHNHLVPNCYPSKKDIETTKQLEIICSLHSVRLLDHYIWSSVGIYSFYTSGLMKKISEQYSVPKIVEVELE